MSEPVLNLHPGNVVGCELPDRRGHFAVTLSMLTSATVPLIDPYTRRSLGWPTDLELTATYSDDPELVQLGILEPGRELATSAGPATVHELAATLTWRRERDLDTGGWRTVRHGWLRLTLLFPMPGFRHPRSHQE